MVDTPEAIAAAIDKFIRAADGRVTVGTGFPNQVGQSPPSPARADIIAGCLDGLSADDLRKLRRILREMNDTLTNGGATRPR
jgi:hypothetical protein